MRPKDSVIGGALTDHTHKWYYEVDGARVGYECCFCDAFVTMDLMKDARRVGESIMDDRQKICDRVWDSVVKGKL
jgi:hypothetical protein